MPVLKYGLTVVVGYYCCTVIVMAVASFCHDNQQHLKTMQFNVHFLDKSVAYFDAEVCIRYISTLYCALYNMHMLKFDQPAISSKLWH